MGFASPTMTKTPEVVQKPQADTPTLTSITPLEKSTEAKTTQEELLNDVEKLKLQLAKLGGQEMKITYG